MAPEGQAVFGVYGQSGNYIDALGVIMRDLPTQLPKESLPGKLPRQLSPLPPRQLPN
jgi:hypothetical protein